MRGKLFGTRRASVDGRGVVARCAGDLGTTCWDGWVDAPDEELKAQITFEA